jgi:hypothetical protein
MSKVGIYNLLIIQNYYFFPIFLKVRKAKIKTTNHLIVKIFYINIINNERYHIRKLIHSL